MSMISDVKIAIVSKLQEVYPIGYVIYDEDKPENMSKPSFLITITNQSHNRRPNNKFINEITFDIAYYSDKPEIRIDSIRVQEELLRAFDFIGTYQARSKSAKITDNVLHITFVIRYTEGIEVPFNFMQQQQTNTNI